MAHPKECCGDAAHNVDGGHLGWSPPSSIQICRARASVLAQQAVLQMHMGEQHTQAPSTLGPIAITGSAGFLGSHLVGLLEDSPRVSQIISLDRKAPLTARNKTRHFPTDLTRHHAEDHLSEILGAERVTTVVHLAFHDSPSHNPDAAHDLESVGTMRILNACRRTGVLKFVMWSQTSLYGASPKNPCYLDERRPLFAETTESFFRDKIQAERDALEFGQPGRGRFTTILRTAPILGPHVDNYFTRYFQQTYVPTVLGFDPLWQFLHEADAVAALKRAIDSNAPGIFNIAGDGVIPLGKAIRLLGRTKVPLTRPAAHLLLGGLWVARAGAIPPTFLNYIQYACVADTDRCRKALGFVPIHSSREAIIEFYSAQQQREFHVLSETPA
jgi:UDP-glucose 4-epimerase